MPNPLLGLWVSDPGAPGGPQDSAGLLRAVDESAHALSHRSLAGNASTDRLWFEFVVCTQLSMSLADATNSEPPGVIQNIRRAPRARLSSFHGPPSTNK
jgi:hypothetical protein